MDNERLKQRGDEARKQHRQLQTLRPAMIDTGRWLRHDLPWWLTSRELGGRKEVYIPVLAIRHAHKTTNSSFALLLYFYIMIIGFCIIRIIIISNYHHSIIIIMSMNLSLSCGRSCLEDAAAFSTCPRRPVSDSDHLLVSSGNGFRTYRYYRLLQYHYYYEHEPAAVRQPVKQLV